MRIRIGHRLFLGFLLIALLVLAVSSGLTRWNFQRGFLGYVEDSEAERLRYLALTVGQAYAEKGVIRGERRQAYAETGSWEPLRGAPDRWLALMGPPETTDEHGAAARPVGRSRDGGVVSEDPLAISPRVTVFDREGKRLFGPSPSESAQRIEPIMYGGEAVGSLYLNPLETLASDLATRFSQQQTRWIYGTSVVALLLASVLAMIFTRHIVSPILELKRGTRALIAGRFNERIEVRTTGELGDLAEDFNSLAETLERNQRTQRQWIADISHELRTPLSILRGELQATEDGVRTLNETTRKSLSSEVERLTDLVNDIYQLSVSDIGALRYRMEIADVADVLREIVIEFEARVSGMGLELQTVYPPEPLMALIDAGRLRQLFANVLENSVRYTDHGGKVRVSCTRQGSEILVKFEDTAPAVPTESLPKLFDRFYRVESTRSRLTGGAGLGLAICKNIAHAHGGRITAGISELGGLSVALRLPASRAEDIESRGIAG